MACEMSLCSIGMAWRTCHKVDHAWRYSCLVEGLHHVRGSHCSLHATCVLHDIARCT